MKRRTIALGALGLFSVPVLGLMILISNRTSSQPAPTSFIVTDKPLPKDDRWKIDESRSPMDGSKTIVARLVAEDDIRGRLKTSRPDDEACSLDDADLPFD